MDVGRQEMVEPLRQECCAEIETCTLYCNVTGHRGRDAAIASKGFEIACSFVERVRCNARQDPDSEPHVTV